jgi:hypothetical protein
MTWRALITSSLRLIGQLGPGRTAGPSETTTAQEVLNAMLSSWNAQRLAVFEIARDEYTLTAGQSDYEIGPSAADFDTARPARIAAAGRVNDAGELPVTVYRWTGPIDRAGLYYDNANPVMGLHVEPTPNAGEVLALYTWRKLAQVTDLDTAVTLPEGYEDAIRYNLAVRMAPEWSKVPRADVQQFARESLAVIKAHNRPSLEMKTDAALLTPASFDIYRGDYR